MSIPSDLLNKTVTVKRLGSSSSSFTDSGAIKKTDNITNVYTGVPIRINKTNPDDQDRVHEVSLVTSEFLGFTDPGYTFEYGDIFVDESTGKEYINIFADNEPGGEVGHHIEIYLNNYEG